ncbi:MAG: histidinol-phosphate transaminase [Clostridiales bacterium]|nr:histidinol-phosphate transaminase [Clostridiales bacterium]
MSRFLRAAYQTIDAYAPGEQPREGVLIKLNTNESPFPPSPGVLAALDPAAAERLNRYSDPTLSDLKAAIADREGLTAEQVTAGNGSDEVLALAFLAFGGRGVAFADITYGFYRVWAAFFGLRSQIVPLREDFSIGVDDYDGAAGMVVLANPNAPTGRAIGPDAVVRLAAADRGRLVVVDEAYVEFGCDSAARLIDACDNLLVVRTFSKSHSLAGARLGYALGCRALIQDLEKMRYSFNPYNVNRLSMLAGVAAMRDEDYYARCRASIARERGRLADALASMGFEVLPSRANFLFARHAALPGAAYADQLRQRGILIRRFDGPRIADFSRVTVGAPGEVDAVIAATSDILKAGGGA